MPWQGPTVKKNLLTHHENVLQASVGVYKGTLNEHRFASPRANGGLPVRLENTNTEAARHDDCGRRAARSRRGASFLLAYSLS